MNVDFVDGLVGNGVAENSQNQMVIGRERVVTVLLFMAEIPIRIKPMRIAGDEHYSLGAISLRQFPLPSIRLNGRNGGSKGELPARTFGRQGRRFITFEKNGGN